MYVCVVGNIGVGKSTIMKKMSFETKMFEPVEKWRDILKKFYTNSEKYALPFQLRVFHDYVKSLLQQDMTKDVVTERSIYCQPLFWEIQPKNDEEDETYNGMWAMWTTLIPPPTHYIFLHTDNIDALLSRIKQRARNGESLIKIDYLEKLNEKYTAFYTRKRFGNKILILDALESPETNLVKINEFLEIKK